MDIFLQNILYILHYIEHFFITPVRDTFYGLFTLQTRQALIFLFVAYVIAYSLYYLKARKGDEDTRQGFFSFLGGKKVFLHPSALLDYQYYFIAPVLKNIFITPVLLFAFLPEYLSGMTVSSFITEKIGPVTAPVEPNFWVLAIYTFGFFLVADFKHYWVHRIFHLPFLWEFHKVHHSAEVLVPQTANRIHFIEELAEHVAWSVLLGFYAGAFMYICGQELSIYEIFGASYLSIIFHSIGSNLRHSHVWLSFGPMVEHVINSPAQHQIHHSINPKHYNRNFGTNLSLWDWMFGTLYTTTPEQEPLEFGLGERENRNYRSFYGVIVYPVKAFFQRLRPLKKRPALKQKPVSTSRAPDKP